MSDTALHEAAHAVVAVRLGISLDYVKVGRGVNRDPDRARSLRYVGQTKPTPGQRDPHVGALFTAAGIAAERMMGGDTYKDDWAGMVEVAGYLKIGTSGDDPAVVAWIEERVADAEKILTDDGEIGWRKVASALRRKRTLTGDNVRKILDSIPGDR